MQAGRRCAFERRHGRRAARRTGLAARDRRRLVSAARAPAARRRPIGARSDHGLPAESRYRLVQLRHPCRRWSRSITNFGIVEILDYVIVEDCGTHGQPDGGRRPDLSAAPRRASARRCYEEMTIRRQRAAAVFDLRRLCHAGRRRNCRPSASCTWRRRRPTPSSASRAWAKAGRSRRRRRSSMPSTMRCRSSASKSNATPLTPRRLLRGDRCGARPAPEEAS